MGFKLICFVLYELSIAALNPTLFPKIKPQNITMASRLVSSLARCSIPRVSFISRSQFYSTTPLISMTLMLRNLISKPCCAVSFRSASSKSSASENDKVKYDDKDLLLVLESVIAQKNMQEKALPKDFPFEIIDNPEDESITLKREYDSEQIKANVFRHFKPRISLDITIDKQVGSTLKFCCNLTPDGFKTCRMSLKSSENSHGKYIEGPVLFDSDERLENAFQEYLAARGFKKSIYDYLDYRMDQKTFAWQRLKGFIEKCPTTVLVIQLDSFI